MRFLAQPSCLVTGWVTLESAEFSWWQWRALRKISVSAPHMALTAVPELHKDPDFQFSHLAKVTLFYIHPGENINPCVLKYWQPQKCCHSWHFVPFFRKLVFLLNVLDLGNIFGKPLITLNIGQCSFKKPQALNIVIYYLRAIIGKFVGTHFFIQKCIGDTY